MNPKRIVAAISAIVLLAIIIIPSVSTASVDIRVGSGEIGKMGKVYVTVTDVWIHEAGQSSAIGWQTIFHGSKTFNLTAASTGAELSRGRVPIGGYDGVRMQLNNLTVVSNGIRRQLTLKSSLVETPADLTVGLGKTVSVQLSIGGQQQTIGGVQYFISTVTVSVP